VRKQKTFADLTRDQGPRPLLVEAVGLVEEKRAALDLGAGALNESRYMLESGFGHVIAIDREPIAKKHLKGFPPDRFEYRVAMFEDFGFPEQAFDLVNAQYSLPFIAADQFLRVFVAIRQSLRPGGIFAGQLFGDRDEWASNARMSFHAVHEARALFSGMKLVSFEEEEADGKTARGTFKHWHVFHVIARQSG
jgi:SAM-dependent methyltransferase